MLCSLVADCLICYSLVVKYFLKFPKIVFSSRTFVLGTFRLTFGTRLVIIYDMTKSHGMKRRIVVFCSNYALIIILCLDIQYSHNMPDVFPNSALMYAQNAIAILTRSSKSYIQRTIPFFPSFNS